MKRHKTIISFLIGITLALSLVVPSISIGDPSEKSEKGKWMTGDWHQHTVFTDGSNIMGDLEIDQSTTPPTFTILNGPDVTDPKAVFPAGTYKGVIPQGFRYGLDFQANSEHGGNRGARDSFGRYWVPVTTGTILPLDVYSFYPPAADIPLLGIRTVTYNNTCDFSNIDSPGCSSPAHQIMWRWQELFTSADVYPPSNYMSAFDWITTLRDQYLNKEILTGMEWNVPGHEHASTGCLENDGKCIAEFEFRFDNTDTDTDAGPAAAGLSSWSGKKQNSFYTVANGYFDYATTLGLNLLHNKAIDGLAWLNAKHPNTSWVNPAHIERAGCGFDYLTNQIKGGYSIAAIRDMNNTAPTVFFGFEGMPGHQKASNRGEVSGTSCGGGTYGGAGTYIATVGGVWDNLLADGRKIFNFVSSDFHMTPDDFYPGEYAKTHVRVKNDKSEDDERDVREDNAEKRHRDEHKFTQQDILNGMRSGNSFAVHGDLITKLDFTLRSGEESATMGETLHASKGHDIKVKIRFKDGSFNNNGDLAKVHHVQLIQGKVNPTRASKLLADGVNPNPDFNKIDTSVAEIAKTFDATSWEADEDGFTTMTFNVHNVENDLFFRVRGTNLDYNVNVVDGAGKTIYGTNPAGSPLLNTAGTNSAAQAWKDLWFYSNPIFVSVE